MKSGGHWGQLIQEEAFLDQLEVARWDGFSMVLRDIALGVEGRLRPYVDAHDLDAMGEGLAKCVDAVLWDHPEPAYRQHAWSEDGAEFRRRVAQARLAAPQPASEIVKEAGNRIYELMPLHKMLRVDDRSVVRNNVRFMTIRAFEELDSRLEPEPAAKSLVRLGREG